MGCIALAEHVQVDPVQNKNFFHAALQQMSAGVIANGT
jgi:hypothetical protein